MYAEAMRNPALVILYVIPALIIGLGISGIFQAATEHQNIDAREARINMAREIGSARDTPSEEEFQELSRLEMEAQQQFSYMVIAGGISGYMIPLTATAIGRSQKNAVRELRRKRNNQK